MTAFLHRDFRPPPPREYERLERNARFSPYASFREHPAAGRDLRRRRLEACTWHLPQDLRMHLFAPDYHVIPGETSGYQDYEGLGWKYAGLEDIEEVEFEMQDAREEARARGAEDVRPSRPVWYSVESDDEDGGMASQGRVGDRGGGFVETLFDVEEMEDGDEELDTGTTDDDGKNRNRMQRDVEVVEVHDQSPPETRNGTADHHIFLDPNGFERGPRHDPVVDAPAPPYARRYSKIHPRLFRQSSPWHAEPTLYTSLQELLDREAKVEAQEAQLADAQIQLEVDRALLERERRLLNTREHELRDLEFLLETERQRIQRSYVRTRSRSIPPLQPPRRYCGSRYEGSGLGEDFNTEMEQEMSDDGELDGDVPMAFSPQMRIQSRFDSMF